MAKKISPAALKTSLRSVKSCQADFCS